MPNERFSDLEAARAAARTLRSGASTASIDRGYVRFDVRRIAGARAPQTDIVAVASEPRFGASGWERLLDASIAAAEAREAFLMNEQGLVIAVRGGMTPDEAEAVGSRVQLALEQADKMAADEAHRRAMMIELDRRWLVGIRFAVGDEASVTLGLFCADLPDATRLRSVTGLLDELVARARQPQPNPED